MGTSILNQYGLKVVFIIHTAASAMANGEGINVKRND